MSSSGGTKHDQGKLRLDLVPIEAIYALAEVFGYGDAKYPPDPNTNLPNWRRGLAFSRLYAAALRHLCAWWQGESLDRESGLNHVKHALANLAMIVAFLGRDDLDDRWTR